MSCLKVLGRGNSWGEGNSMATGGKEGWKEDWGYCVKACKSHDKRYGFSTVGSHFYIKTGSGGT